MMLRALRRLVASVRRRRLDRDLQQELRQHLEWTAEALRDEGVPDAEAHRQAAVVVGNIDRFREEARAMWGFPTLDGLLQDVRYALRLLRRSPTFSCIAVVSLAVGIGASVAVFSLADTVLLRRLAVHDPDSLVILKWRSGNTLPFSSLNGYGEQTADGAASTSFSYAAYQSFARDDRGDLDLVAFADLDQINVSVDGRAELATGEAVSGNYFDVLGVQPVLGRALGALDDRADAAPAAVVSDRFWHDRLGGTASAFGKVILINSVPFNIAGVAPPTFQGTGQIGTDPDVYVPLLLHAKVLPHDDPLMDPNFWWVLMMGRLKPGATAARAQSTLDVLLKQGVAASKPALAAKDLPRMTLLPGGRGQVEERNDMADPLQTMGLVAGLVLLVACANVASLLLARGRARARELSIRMAIGSARMRILRQLLTEAIVLAALGGVLGATLAYGMSGLLAPALSTGAVPTPVTTSVDLRVLLFVIAVVVGCAVAFGLAPAFRASGVNVSATLKTAGRGGAEARNRRRLGLSLLVGQMALSLLLVTTAGLLVRTVQNLQHADLGFNASNLLLFRVDPSLNDYTSARAVGLYSRVLDRLRSTPGVTSASLSSAKLISNSGSVGVASRPDDPPPVQNSDAFRAFARAHRAWRLTVDERFFHTMDIPEVRGRGFEPTDAGGAPVAVINRVMAQQLFGSADAIGRDFYLGSARRPGDAPVRIIGLVDNARYSSIRDDMPPTVYVYYAQQPQFKAPVTFEVRTAGAPLALVSSVRDIMRAIDPQVPVFGFTTQRDQIDLSLRQEVLFARLATLLGGVSLVLCAVGLYGSLAYTVAQRTPEIGIRVALGAAPGRVHWMVLRESLWLSVASLAIGVPAALAGTRVVASMLFGLAPRDPVTLALAGAAVVAVAVVAAFVPARRAARVDPLTALRTN